MINSNTMYNHHTYPRMEINPDIENPNLRLYYPNLPNNENPKKNNKIIWLIFIIVLILFLNYLITFVRFKNTSVDDLNLEKQPIKKIEPIKDETTIQTRIWQRKFFVEPINEEFIKHYSEFVVSFNTTIGLPNYTKHIIKNSTSGRCKKNYIIMDKELNTRTYRSFPYPPYTAGHLVPAIDVLDSCSTFIMSNIAPQIRCFNSGPWKSLEIFIRKNYLNHTIYTVPEYNLRNMVRDKKNKWLPIPIGFYKIIVKGDKMIRSFYLEHNTGSCNKRFEAITQNKLPYFMKNK